MLVLDSGAGLAHEGLERLGDSGHQRGLLSTSQGGLLLQGHVQLVGQGTHHAALNASGQHPVGLGGVLLQRLGEAGLPSSGLQRLAVLGP